MVESDALCGWCFSAMYVLRGGGGVGTKELLAGTCRIAEVLGIWLDTKERPVMGEEM